MAQQASARSYKIDRLNYNNYQPWRMTMEILLQSRDLMGIVDGTKPRPAAGHADLADWIKADLAARLELLLHMEDSQKQNVRLLTSAKDIWDRLKGSYEHKDVSSQFHLYSVLVFDAYHNGIPVAWIITSSSTIVNTQAWLIALRDRVLDLNKSWEANAWMVDDAEAEIQALQAVFGIPIYLCLWHVRRCWLKHLIKKVADAQTRATMFRELGNIMNMRGKHSRSMHDKEQEAATLVRSFMDTYKTQLAFINYFKEEWLPKIGMWIRASRMLPHANQETNGSIESYHGVLKSKFLCGRRTIHGRRIDWLIQKLVCSCHSYYWYQDMLKDAGFKQNLTVLGLVMSSFERAQSIPDDHVCFLDEDKTSAIVRSQTHDTVWYTVSNIDCEWACCDCAWAMKGNVCKHQMKGMMLVGLHTDKIVAMTMAMYKEGGPHLNRQNLMNCTRQNEDPEPSSPLRASTPSPRTNVDEENSDKSMPKVVNVEKIVQEITTIFNDTLTVAVKEESLLLHAKYLASQMLDGLQEFEARQQNTASHPCGQFQRLEDGFGNTLQRAKPFVESGFPSSLRRHVTSANVEVQPFPKPTKKKKKGMQKKLDELAGNNPGL